MGTVAASSIVLGRHWMTGAISTGTFTIEPCICNCPPLGKLYKDMNGILKETNLSSNAYRESSGGLVGNDRPFATASFGILCCFNCCKHVLHSHSLLSIDTLPVKHLSFISILTEVNFAVISTTEWENHVWWQHVQTNIGPTAITSWKWEIHSLIFCPYFCLVCGHITCDLFEHWALLSVLFCFLMRSFVLSTVLNSELARLARL